MVILAQKDLQIINQETFTTINFESISVEFAGQTNNIRITNIYCPRGEIEEADLTEVNARISSYNLIVGDFNCHHDIWEGSMGGRRGRTLTKFIEDNNLTVFNDGSITRIDAMYNRYDSAIDVKIATQDLARCHCKFRDD